MSRKSLRAVDLYCQIANWEDSIEGSREWSERCAKLIAGGDKSGTVRAYKAEADGEIERWSALRDKYIARLRKLIASFDERDKRHSASWNYKNPPDYVLAGIEKFRQQLRSIGVEPTW